MNAEQLNSARLARWSQNGEARLTLEAAVEWLSDTGFCPYLPMNPSGGAPAPSFLEAVVGRPAQTPSAGERSRALQLLARLIENSSAVPLKLGSSLGEQPDFVSSPEVLRFLYALRGDRNFKTGPLTVGNEKVTPLSLHCWQAIEQQGPMNVAALQPILGRDITEAAILRALQELWTGMYIFPVLSAAGAPAQWELLFRRFPQPIAAGASTGHAEAQSAMISLYLQASVAAREDEILAFLSSLAPQSKLREVIRGLGSMRQLDILDISGRAHVALQGGLLPEMVMQLSEELLAASPASPEIGAESVIEIEPRIEIEASSPVPQRPWQAKPLVDSDEPRRFVAKKFVPRHVESAKPAHGGFAARSSTNDKSARPFGNSKSRSGDGSFSRPAKPYAPRPRSFAAGAGENSNRGRFVRQGADRNPRAFRDPASREPFSGDRKEQGPKPYGPKGYAAKARGMGERAKRWEKSGEVPEAPSTASRPFVSKSSGFRSAGFKSGPSKFRGSKPFGAKPAGYKGTSSKPWQSKSSGSDTHEGHRKPWKKFSATGDSRTDSNDAARKPYAAGSSGFKPRTAKPWQRKPATATGAGAKPYRTKSSGFTHSGFKSAGSKAAEGRSSEARSSEARPARGKPWGSRGTGSRSSKEAASKGAESRVGSAKSYAARASGKPYSKAGGAKPWAKRSASASAEGESTPKRRIEAAEHSEASPQEKKIKPFWAKNPRGGKGSSAASRTNRPRGKKTTRKSGKKK